MRQQTVGGRHGAVFVLLHRQTRRGIALSAGLLGLVITSSGCCWFAKRTCYPSCPKPITKTITIEKPCRLPPKLKLAAVRQMDCQVGGRPAVCFDMLNAVKLAQREADLKDWIREARARCSSSQNLRLAPTSQPSRPAP